MKDFFEQFKEYLLNEQKENLKKFIPYYETAYQAKDRLQELIDDCRKYFLQIYYEPDKTDGYSEGTFEFHLYKTEPNSADGWRSKLNYHYIMSLDDDQRMWGYCQCTPEDEGYNPIHDCCGNGCDWYAPVITLNKIVNVAYHPFEGVERDLWKLEESWDEKKIDYEQEKKKKQLERIENEIKYLEEQKTKLLNDK